MLLRPVKPKCNVVVEHDGYTMNLREWADFLKVPYDALRMRYKRGKRGDDLFEQIRPKTPKTQQVKSVEVDEEIQKLENLLADWSDDA